MEFLLANYPSRLIINLLVTSELRDPQLTINAGVMAMLLNVLYYFLEFRLDFTL